MNITRTSLKIAEWERTIADYDRKLEQNAAERQALLRAQGILKEKLHYLKTKNDAR